MDMEQDLLNYLDTEAQINQFDKSSFNSDNSRSPAHHKHESELPHSIPALIKEQISSLTKMAKSNENEGKMKFFSAEVNNLLLGIEQGSQNLSTRDRSAVYQLLTLLVPCSKDTLIKRMKKLHSSKQDEDLRQPMHRLKLAIDEVMDEQMRQYDEECAAQQLAKLDDRVAAASTDEDEDGVVPPSGEEKTKRTYAPRRKFKWTDKIRTLFFDVVQAKVIQIEAQKNKTFQSAEENLKTFFENEVKVLWPKGWIQARMLFKESREIHYKITGNT
uniref:Ubinuclein middle domain-containing protein n=4 Tax=Ciona intestinalis TaxID=7719 RepID=F6WVE1_CIOIN